MIPHLGSGRRAARAQPGTREARVVPVSQFLFLLTVFANAAPVLTVNGTSANYTTSKLYADEIAGTSVPLVIVLNPDETQPVTAAEVFTNLNNRDRANDDADGDGIEDGIQPPSGDLVVAGNDIHYYTAVAMSAQGGGSFSATLQAVKTGAYRLTARWKVQGDDTWRYYTDDGAGRRDHAITVSPTDARDISLYEINTLTIEAKATGGFIERSTFEDLHDAAGAPRTVDGKGFNLDYLGGLGVNWLWFQPVHPAGIDGRETDPVTNQLYVPGSPYAVKNFFEINPWMSASYDGSSNISSVSNRAAAMVSFQDFAAAADGKGIGIMLDAPFNHTSYDVELAQAGVDLFQRDGDPTTATTEIRNYDARFFSRANDYCQRARNAGDIAIAPDRGDFGKFVDTYDVFFGRYSSLVCTNPDDNGARLNEDDQFFFNDPNWIADDITHNGVATNITKQVWKYFAEYSLFWLEKTGYPEGTPKTEATRGLGIDGLRCDFGQGLPPRAWEYISNVARERKWNFVLMTESLDGGAVTYRSNRHFDILNENIVFPLRSAGSANDYRNIFDTRRAQYSDSLVLTNTVSHDEENYQDPFVALTRYAVTNSVQGVPMVFMGQEQGISFNFGFTFYENNLDKNIGHFKKFNSLQPLWDDTSFANAQLYQAYSAMGLARRQSPALRSLNEFYLSGNNSNIHAIAKYTSANTPPNAQEVVLAFGNIDRDDTPGGTFSLPAGLLGIKSSRAYNIRNIAAFDPAKRDDFIWPDGGFTGATLAADGIFVALNRVPVTDAGWSTAPYEAQYLRLFDVTPPPAPDKPVATAGYVIGTSAIFTWDVSAFTPDDVASSYVVNGSSRVTGNSAVVSGAVGTTVTARVSATTPAGVTGPESPASDPVKLLSPGGDEDGDGQSNLAERTAGTDPLDRSSLFKVLSFASSPGSVTLNTNSVSGKTYRLWTSVSLEPEDWVPVGEGVSGTGGTLDFAHAPALGDAKRFYRVGVE